MALQVADGGFLDRNPDSFTSVVFLCSHPKPPTTSSLNLWPKGKQHGDDDGRGGENFLVAWLDPGLAAATIEVEEQQNKAEPGRQKRNQIAIPQKPSPNLDPNQPNWPSKRVL